MWIGAAQQRTGAPRWDVSTVSLPFNPRSLLTTSFQKGLKTRFLNPIWTDLCTKALLWKENGTKAACPSPFPGEGSPLVQKAPLKPSSPWNPGVWVAQVENQASRPRKGNMAHPNLCLWNELCPDLTEMERTMLLSAYATRSHCLMPSLSDSHNPSAAPSYLSLESLLPSDTQGPQSLVPTLLPAAHTRMPIQISSQPQASPSFLPAHTTLSPGNNLPHSPSLQNVTSWTLSLSAPQRSLHLKGLLFTLTFPVPCSDHLYKSNVPLSTLRAFFSCIFLLHI